MLNSYSSVYPSLHPGNIQSSHTDCQPLSKHCYWELEEFKCIDSSMQADLYCASVTVLYLVVSGQIMAWMIRTDLQKKIHKINISKKLFPMRTSVLIRKNIFSLSLYPLPLSFSPISNTDVMGSSQ